MASFKKIRFFEVDTIEDPNAKATPAKGGGRVGRVEETKETATKPGEKSI